MGAMTPYGGEGPQGQGTKKWQWDDPDGIDDPSYGNEGFNDCYGYDQRPPSEDEGSTAAPTSADEGLSDSAWDCNSLADSVIPPWDGRLAREQLCQWEVEEKKLGIVRSVKGWLAAKQKMLGKKKQPPKPPDTSTGETFYPSSGFCGQVPGFAFGTTEKGTGYFRDTGIIKATRRHDDNDLVIEAAAEDEDETQVEPLLRQH